MSLDKPQMKEFLGSWTRKIRRRLGISQDKMSELLHITPRAYSDLERKKYCLSTSSLLLLMTLMTTEELEEFIKDFKEMLKKREEIEKA